MFDIDHLGIAVKSLAKAKEFYRTIGLVAVHEEILADEKVRVAMLAVGESRIELLEATSPDSAVARFIAKRGEGMHHVALRVDDLAATVEQLKQRGAKFVSEEIKIGSGGHLYVFLHPSSTGGVLLELCEDQPEGV
jgi:methylmalonyl-CoA/ethylmalonyl-CoA epimerase